MRPSFSAMSEHATVPCAVRMRIMCSNFGRPDRSNRHAWGRKHDELADRHGRPRGEPLKRSSASTGSVYSRAHDFKIRHGRRKLWLTKVGKIAGSPSDQTARDGGCESMRMADNSGFGVTRNHRPRPSMVG